MLIMGSDKQDFTLDPAFRDGSVHGNLRFRYGTYVYILRSKRSVSTFEDRFQIVGRAIEDSRYYYVQLNPRHRFWIHVAFLSRFCNPLHVKYK